MRLASIKTGLHIQIDNVVYRIERIYESGQCVLERLHDRAIAQRSKDELMNLFTDGRLQINGKIINFEASNERISVDLNSLCEEQQQKISRKREYVIGVQKLLGEKPTKINIEQAISQVAKYLDDSDIPSVSSVWRWWNLWINSSNNIIVFLGGRSKNFKSRFKNPIVREVIVEAIEEHYLTNQRTPVQDVYDWLCHRFNEINQARLTPLKTPSRATFYRIIKNLDQYECMSSRIGKAAADRQFRTTGSGLKTTYILERVEVDHTPLDVMVVNDKTNLVDGRPWITVLLDVHSKMVLGFAIGFEPPSELSVMNALRNAILPKPDIRKKFPKVECEWHAYGIPIIIICDNGAEFHSKNLRRVCAELNIELQFCPKQQPNYKGAVERFLGTLNRAVCHRIPGSTFSNINARKDYDSEKFARVSLSELKSFIHEWIIDIYSHETNRMTGHTPHELWQKGLTQREPILPESIQQLALIFSKETTRSLNHDGINIFGLIYNSSELAVLRKRSTNAYKVRVRYDVTDLANIWVYDDVNGDYINVPSIHPEYTTRLSLLEHKGIRELNRGSNQANRNLHSLLARKAKYTEDLKKQSQNKLLKQRQRAARHNLHKAENFKSDLAKYNQDTPSLLDDFDIADIPKFNVGNRGDK